MEWMSLNELREKYLSFFETKGHLRLPSFSLIPQHDKSLLLIPAGMAPLKPYFTGAEEPPCRRVTTCQKCMRTPDLERVGITARHGTYFEMLGNFSFGDYFKKEAIPWAWEFLTEWLHMPPEKLYPSVYEEDDEAFEIWNKVVGVPAERITRLGKADNFWEHGSGPCGPCSEIYFDRGAEHGCGSPDCRPGCDCDRFMEIWNNVFTQFDNDGNGNYTLLKSKNIDTGMGLERLACVIQGVDNMFEVDTIRKILDTVCEIAGKKYGANEKDDISIRIVTDHIRASTFLICDGVLPSNEKRGYVLRRILRRAARHGKLLGIDRPFLFELCGVVIGENKGAYPELAEKADYIRKIIKIEEERFDATIDAGLSILSGMIDDSLKGGKNAIDGADVFRLYDTFGFPIDLTKEIAAERSLQVDEDEFLRLMKTQRERARNARGNIGGWSDASKTILADLPKTEFTGYTENETKARVLAIVVDDIFADSVSEGDFSVILDKTPFYGEGGGQVGDSGYLHADGLTVSVSDTKKSDGVYIHLCTVANGTLKVGDTVHAEIDVMRRSAIRRNHSSAHLLQAALRKVLGTHVEQAGSYVDENRVRFDFSHFAAMTREELDMTEHLVNAHILAGAPITTTVTDIESAKKMGAMALFGEKYGDVVRVVKMGEFSCELCGGTHLDNTGKMGLFKIISESSVAAGVRRIEGTTGYGVLALLDDSEKLIADTAAALKSSSADIERKAVQLQGELRDAHREIDALNSKLAASKTDGLLEKAVAVKSVRLIAADLGDMAVDTVRGLCDTFRDSDPDVVCVFAVHSGDKLNFVGCCGKNAVANGAHCGKIISAVSAVTGGKGGGRPDSAMSGGKDISKLSDALAEAKTAVEAMIK